MTFSPAAGLTSRWHADHRAGHVSDERKADDRFRPSGFLRGIQLAYAPLAERLASHGFVVVNFDVINVLDVPNLRARQDGFHRARQASLGCLLCDLPDQTHVAKAAIAWLKRLVDEDTTRYDALTKTGLQGSEYSRYELGGF